MVLEIKNTVSNEQLHTTESPKQDELSPLSISTSLPEPVADVSKADSRDAAVAPCDDAKERDAKVEEGLAPTVEHREEPEAKAGDEIETVAKSAESVAAAEEEVEEAKPEDKTIEEGSTPVEGETKPQADDEPKSEDVVEDEANPAEEEPAAVEEEAEAASDGKAADKKKKKFASLRKRFGKKTTKEASAIKPSEEIPITANPAPEEEAEPATENVDMDTEENAAAALPEPVAEDQSCSAGEEPTARGCEALGRSCGRGCEALGRSSNHTPGDRTRDRGTRGRSC